VRDEKVAFSPSLPFSMLQAFSVSFLSLTSLSKQPSLVDVWKHMTRPISCWELVTRTTCPPALHVDRMSFQIIRLKSRFNLKFI
jgi:hypothetical protein